MSTKRHALGVMSIAVVFVILVGFGLAWTNYRTQAGITYNEIISEQSTESKSEIETVKRLAIPALEYSTKDASLQIAASGGTLNGETVWYCDTVSNPPDIYEVLGSMSNLTLTNFNKFLDESTEISEILKLEVVPYTCSGIYPEKPDTCPQGSYPETCDGWNVTATGGYIYDSTDDESHRHIQDVKATATEDRFFWMYYRLLEAEDRTPILAEVQDVYYDTLNCESNDPECCITAGDLTAAFNGVMAGTPDFFGNFDEFVECDAEIECAELRSIAIKINCTDTKYTIPADDESGEKYLTWVIKEMVTIGCNYEECVIVPVIGGGSSSGGGSTGMPSVSMSGTTKSTSSETYKLAPDSCSDHMQCFNIDRCTHETEEELCFDP